MASFSVYHSNAPKRNFVLDVFRGLAVVLMIVVDAVPDLWTVYPTLVHSPWEGIHAADLAFPGFVFAMGASAVFSWTRSWRKKKRLMNGSGSISLTLN